MMRFVKVPDRNAVPFAYLKVGDTFAHTDRDWVIEQIYIKIEEVSTADVNGHSIVFNAVNTEAGTISTFDDAEVVYPVDVVATYSYQNGEI